MNNTQATIKALAGLQLAYSQTLDAGRFRLYVQMLSDYPPLFLDAAVKKLILASKFMPTIAEIRTVTDALLAERSGTTAKTYGEAWQEVLAAIQQYGSYTPPAFTSKSIAETVKCMGWRNLCHSEEQDAGMYFAQFRVLYQQMLARYKDDALNKVVGLYKIPLLPAKTNNIDSIGNILAPLSARKEAHRD